MGARDSSDRHGRLSAPREGDRLFRLAAEIQAKREPRGILRAALRGALRLSNASAAVGGLVEADALVFSELVTGSVRRAIRLPLRPADGIPGRILETGRPYRSEHAASDPEISARLRRELAPCTLLAVPILAPGDVVLGCLEVHDRRDGRPFNDEDTAWLCSLSRLVAAALRRAEDFTRRLRAAEKRADRRGGGADVREAKDYLEAVIHASHDGILVLDEEGRFEFCNEAILGIAGRTKEDFIGRHLLEIIRPENREFVRRQWEKARSGQTGLYDMEIMRPDGEPRSLTVTHRRFRAKGGYRYCVMVKDVTLRRAAEREALRQRDLAGRYLRIAGSLIVALDEEGRITLANHKTCELLGRTEGEILGRSWFDLALRRRDRSGVRRAFRRLLSSEEPEFYENVVVAADGSERIIEWHNTVLRDEAGRPAGTLSSGMDVTERKRVEDELRALAQNLEARVAERTGVAEARTRQLRALTGELSRVELNERRRVAQLLHEHFQQLLVAARMHIGIARGPDASVRGRSLDTADEILRSAIRETRTLAVELSPPILFELGLGAAVDWLGRRSEDMYNLVVKVDGASILGPADPGLRALLFESVRELLFNVVKHSGVLEARIRLRSPRAGETVITVSDRGVGMTPDRTWAETGAGIGLLSIREKLEAAGGSIVVRSAPDAGTRVTLRIREATGSPPEKAPLSAPPRPT